MEHKDLNAYIDGDIIVYRCAFAAEKTHYLVTHVGENELYEDYRTAMRAVNSLGEEGMQPLLWSRKEIQPVEFALQAAKTTMEALVERFKWSRVYLSGPDNFRDSIGVTRPYKGNRDRTKDPVYKQDVTEYLIREYGAIRTSGYEADDAIGISLSGDPNGCAVTIDKDLDQIAGWHYNWVSGEGYRVSRQEADFSLYTQVLSGDATDNIPGLAGIGPVKARAILDGSKSSRELAERTWRAYRDRFDSREAAEEYFIEQLALVRILREPFDNLRVTYDYLPKGFSFE